MKKEAEKKKEGIQVQAGGARGASHAAAEQRM